MPKKAMASKRPRGSTSSEFNTKRFVSTEAEARFNDSITRISGLKERDFDLDSKNPRVEYFQRVIKSRGWQIFYKHPKAATMTVVREFYMNTVENTSTLVVFVREKQVRYDVGTINQLLHLQYTPHGLDELDILAESANMEEISTKICGRVTKWNIVRGEHAHLFLRSTPWR